MADPATGAATSADRRNRRNERRRRRGRRVVGILASLAILAGFVLLATDAVRFGGSDTPSLAGTVHAEGGQSAAATVTTTKSSKSTCRTLSTTDPLRLWVGGDSLAGSLGPSLGADSGRPGRLKKCGRHSRPNPD